MKPDGFLYPPPSKTEGVIIACVVEKKGDETGTSMRQSEIYAYSQDIRIRDGYMVMPKYHWNAFTPGDWFFTKPIYAVDRHNKQGDERELSDISKINQSDHHRHKIPPTKFQNGTLMIKCPFIFCPEFIRNKTTRNSYGSYRKLYVMDMGQGFVHNSRHEFKSLDENELHIGVFEFRAKDNGAVNFAISGEIRDHTGHVLERDAMWELTKVLKQTITDEMRDAMKLALNNLFALAKSFDEELEKIKANKVPSKLLDARNDDTVADFAVKSGMEGLTISRNSTPTNASSGGEEQEDQEVSDEDTLVDTNDPLMFTTKEELEAYRATVIVKIKVNENGVETEKWTDRETGEMCLDDDILNFKFHCRHAISEIPQRGTFTNRNGNRVIQPQSTVQQNAVTQSAGGQGTSAQGATTQNIQRNRNLSESSVRSNTLGQPLASSTPRPSPEAQRRNMPFIPAEIDEGEEEEARDLTTHVNQTTESVLMCRDNNANPIRDRARR